MHIGRRKQERGKRRRALVIASAALVFSICAVGVTGWSAPASTVVIQTARSSRSGSSSALSHTTVKRLTSPPAVLSSANSIALVPILLEPRHLHTTTRLSSSLLGDGAGVCFKTPILGVLFNFLLQRFIMRRAKTHRGLDIKMSSFSFLQMLFGKIASLRIQFEQLSLEAISISGGAVVDVSGIDILPAGFLGGPLRGFRKLRSPCEVFGHYTFTKEDLTTSPSILRLANSIVNSAVDKQKIVKILARAGGRIHVDKVQTHKDKLEAVGMIRFLNPLPMQIPFTARARLAVNAGDGQVLHVREPEMKVSGVFIPMKETSVDCGSNVVIEKINVCRTGLEMAMRVLISPHRPLTVASVRQRGFIFHDLGETLSDLVCSLLQVQRF